MALLIGAPILFANDGTRPPVEVGVEDAPGALAGRFMVEPAMVALAGRFIDMMQHFEHTQTTKKAFKT